MGAAEALGFDGVSLSRHSASDQALVFARRLNRASAPKNWRDAEEVHGGGEARVMGPTPEGRFATEGVAVTERGGGTTHVLR